MPVIDRKPRPPQPSPDAAHARVPTIQLQPQGGSRVVAADGEPAPGEGIGAAGDGLRLGGQAAGGPGLAGRRRQLRPGVPEGVRKGHLRQSEPAAEELD